MSISGSFNGVFRCRYEPFNSFLTTLLNYITYFAKKDNSVL